MKLSIGQVAAIILVALVGGTMAGTFGTYQVLSAMEAGYATEVLVGTGCEGPSSVAVGWEEDELPRCEQIEVHVF